MKNPENKAVTEKVYEDRDEALAECREANANREPGERLVEVHGASQGGWRLKRTMFYG